MMNELTIFENNLSKKYPLHGDLSIDNIIFVNSEIFIIDWQIPLEEIRNKIRVHAKPFNPAETILFNRYVLINKAKPYTKAMEPLQGPGVIKKVLNIFCKNFLITIIINGSGSWSRTSDLWLMSPTL